MKFELIRHSEDCRKLILIFTGWSTGPEIYRDLNFEGWDLAIVHDYSDLNFDSTVLSSYSTIWLFAWSLGIVVASEVLPAEMITAAYAINGSLNPVNDEEGIPDAVYTGTYTNLDQRNLAKFRRRMSPDADTYRRLFDTEFTVEDIESLRAQLKNLQNIGNSGKINWRKAFISNGDRIFPPQNMMNSWKSRNVKIIELEGAHYYPMADIIRSVLPMPHRIAEKFHSANQSYDRHAVAQNKIAKHLSELIYLHSDHHPEKILEIGPFTGLLTRKYARFVKPTSAHFVDICPIKSFGIFGNEEYFCEDAENWIEKSKDMYDMIISASTIQWFSNIPQFLKNCKRHLKPGGILAISSFVEGNLKELDLYRPTPLHYPTAEDISKWMKAEFTDFIIETEELPILFNDKRELLMHLKHTGVNAGGQIPHSPLSLPDSLTTLTYLPIYIIGRI